MKSNLTHMIFKKTASALIILTLLASAAAGFSASNVEAVQPVQRTAYQPGRLIVKFLPNVTQAKKQQFLGKYHAKTLRKFKNAKSELIQVSTDRSLEAWRKIFKSSGLVKYADPDYKVHIGGIKKYSKKMNDTYMGKQWGLNNTGQNGGKKNADIDAPGAWSIYDPKAPIIVAVIDSGVDFNHKELCKNIWINEKEDINHDGQMTDKDKNGKDDDGNGYVDDVIGWDFANWDRSPMDDCDHGTHVAGIIAARGNNKYGVVGVAGQGEVRIMPLKFLDADGSGYTSDAITAIEYATANGAFLANNSWGGASYSQALKDAIAAYGTSGGLFIVAAGNDGKNLDNKADYPASYGLDRMVVVGSINRNDSLSNFSNYGKATVHLAAPGSSILSTIPKNKFDTFSGTSMATPFVVGVAALIWNENPNINATSVKQILLESVRPNSKLAKVTVTGGVANAKKSVATAKKR